MKTNQFGNTFVSLRVIFSVLAISTTAEATLINFDNLSISPGIGSPITSYGGLQWNNFNVKNTLGASPSGYLYGTVSPNNVAYNSFGTSAYIFAQSFDFNSAYLTAALNDGLNVEVQGFVGNTLAYDNTYILNTESPTLINFNYLGVREVNFISSGGVFAGYPGFVSGTQFVLDNITINAIPEPTALALVSLGSLASLVAFRRK